MGIGQLEDLYRLILTSFENIDDPAQDTNRRASQLRGFQHVIGTILVLDKPLTIHHIIALLADVPEHDFDVANFLQRFRSVLTPSTATSFVEATPQMHKSFRDYIMDTAPDGFRISTGHAHFMTARSCLEQLKQHANKDKIQAISNTLMKAKVYLLVSREHGLCPYCSGLPHSLFLAFWSLAQSVWFSSITHVFSPSSL
ncbi:hypothetical protein B0H16DRAFT_238988 [Mycena metata]|uniref:TANC1/2-like winged helix domain-containing protein n=1 Tax=Mycena metata TaxID=1033252 RepID=A0AAD7JQZ2_9AGAR|nr:hypothetical protein B0H16DRAFT_238988 [Mycena metata]